MTGDQRPVTRDQRSETRDQRPETRDQRPETRDQKKRRGERSKKKGIIVKELTTEWSNRVECDPQKANNPGGVEQNTSIVPYFAPDGASKVLKIEA